MGWLDRALRILFGLLLVLISPVGLDLLNDGFMAWFCLVFGAANLISSVVGWCFMYSLIGISSRSPNLHLEAGGLEPLNYKQLRNRSVIGFGAISLMVSSLYITEGYDSAKDLVHRMELNEIHNIVQLVGDEVISGLEPFELDAEDRLSKLVTESMLQRALYHFNDPMLVVLFDDAGSVMSSKQIAPELSEALRSYFSEDRLHLLRDADNHQQLEHPSKEHSEHQEATLVKVGDTEYAWAYHPLSGSHPLSDSQTEGNPSWILLARESHGRAEVFTEVISRLSISSLVVFWLSVWGAVGVAFFIWRHVEQSNRFAVQAAKTDPETGLLNEPALREVFERIQKSGGDQHYIISAIKFRNYSDIVSTAGAALTSALLKDLGCRLKGCLKPECTLAKLNSGNFVLLTPAAEIRCLEQFRSQINNTQLISSYQFSLDPTEVVIRYPQDIRNFDDLLSSISALMFSAGRARLSRLEYDEKLIHSRQKSSQYAAEIKQALSERQFELYLQPKIDLRTQQTTGAEALIRWNHPEDGLLTPYHFLAIVENSNARVEFATFVVNEVYRQFLTLHQRGLPINISFNLSSYDILDESIQGELRRIAAELGEQTALLEVELTESQTSIETYKIAAALNEISELGFTIALDDFGTGMSSLSFSHLLPIDTIKIDKSFVDLLSQEPESRLPIESILSLAKAYGYRVVAEGVETACQVAALKEIGCSLCQGYFYGKPMPLPKLISFIQEQADQTPQ